MKLTYYPAFSEPQTLLHQVVRACWYLKHLPLEKVTFYLDGDFEFAFERPDYYDSGITADYEALSNAGRLSFVRSAVPDRVEADALIAWDALEAANQLADRSQVEQVFNVNFQHRMEGSFYVDVVDRLAGNGDEAIATGAARLTALRERLGTFENAYLFCTGPSVTEYEHYRLENGVGIICNSVINDEALMTRVRPQIHVFADPIFHFGCSSYAFEFRRKLMEVSQRYNLTHIVPIKYWSLFQAQMPELAERSLPVPFSHEQPINLDLSEQFLLKTTDNILTFLMLPLATTLAEQIWLFGCDGRPLSEDSYFWNHNPRVQFEGEMASIQLAHPSFFKLDYNEYYLRHCARLEEYLLAGESLGKRFVSASFSHIPALAERAFPLRVDPGKNQLLLSINPDLEDEFGHFLHMDNRIAQAAGEDCQAFSLANRKADLQGSATGVVPTFSANTWSARTRTTSDDPLIEQFGEELTAIAHSLKVMTVPARAYMYTGDVSHLAAMLNCLPAIRAAGLQIHLNLFFASFDVFDDAFADAPRHAFYEETIARFHANAADSLMLYVESDRTAQRLHALFGLHCARWPMLSITDEALFAAAPTAPREIPRVVFPGTGQLAKGIDTACAAIEAYRTTEQLPAAQFALRDLQKDTAANNAAIRASIDRLKDWDQVRVLEGILTEADYAELYSSATVIVVPYRWHAFQARTSAAVVDALYFGVPVVVTAETWLSDEAMAFDLCVPFEDGNPISLRDAIAQALAMPKVADLSAHRARWRERYGAMQLLQAFDRSAGNAPPAANGSGQSMKESLTMSAKADTADADAPHTADAVTALKALLQSQTAHAEALRVAESLLDARVELQARISTLTERVHQLEAQLAEAQDESAQGALSNRDLYQKFDRTLTRAELDTLLSKWLPLLKLEMNSNSLAYAADLICGVEARSIGRLASGIQDAVLRSLVARAAAQDGQLSYLEIGSLFGVNMCTVYELTRYELDQVHMSSIDPLDSYYDQSKDVLTGMPISESIVRRNLDRSVIPSGDYRLIKHLSTEPEALQAASEASYHCLLIDGDHSYEGVKNDYELFSGLIAAGGYLIVDDYGAKEWPYVTRFVDETIRTDKQFTYIGHDWRTIVFQRNGP